MEVCGFGFSAGYIVAGASMFKKTATSKPTKTSGRGEAVAPLKVSDRAIPVDTTAQFVVASSRVRQTVLR